MMTPMKLLSDKVADGRRVMIYGAGSQGRGVSRSLRDGGIEPAGFIDRNPGIQNHVLGGIPVYDPSLLDAPCAANSLFVIVAAFFFESEIAAFLEERGFAKGVSYLPYSALKSRDYAIEVSGICNLRCISCPRADRRPSGRNAVMMGLETFTEVVAKIRREDPFVGNIQLYQWGEPTLNRSLPDIIRRAGEKGFLCSVSSNLNHVADFRSLIAARPECLRLSASGLGADYEITHTGGKWGAFLANLETVSELRRELYPAMKVELYYHRYKNSVGEPQDKMAELCRRHGFEFHPVPAYIISLDDVLAYCEGHPLPEPARRARELLLVDIDEGLRRAGTEAHLECDATRVILINADLSVSACMMFYDPGGNTVADNYLETPLEEIIARRAGAALCARCRKHGVHRYCGIYAQISEEERY
jgi:MoaA/NifB/PqqE/SkfB family radical SAM enzyme